MAPAPQPVYFPALDKCFSRELSLLSWKTANEIVSASDPSPAPALDSFFRDPQVIATLSQPLRPFPRPSAQSKSDLDTRTAVPPNDGQYDINQVKQDALWLSKEADVDELAALRIVVLEWQQRAAAQLLTEWSEEEQLSVQNATASFRASTAPFSRSPLQSTFDADEQRHFRLLAILCAEQTSVLSLSASLVALNLPDRDNDPLTTTPMHHAATAIWNNQKDAAFFKACVETLKTQLSLLSDPTKWPTSTTDNAGLANNFILSIFAQMVSVLRLTYLHTFNSDALTSPESMLAWFELMDQHLFLSELPDLPRTADVVLVIQCLVSLISVELVKLKDIMEHVAAMHPASDQVSYPDLSKSSYWENDQCIRTITATLLGASAQRIRHASPAVLAWSIVAQSLRDVVSLTKSERQLDDNSSDTEQSPPLSRTPSLRRSGGTPSNLELKLDLIMDTLPTEDPIAIMANIAVNELHVFELVTSISECLLLAFANNINLHLATCGKLTLLALLREGFPLFQYGQDLVQAVLSVLSYDTVPQKLLTTRTQNPPEPLRSVMTDVDIMGARFLEQIQQRYAYELRPFLACLLSISQSSASIIDGEPQVIAMLDNMSAFTQAMPLHFVDYELVQEDVMVNYIQLTRNSPIFSPKTLSSRQLSITSGRDHRDSQKAQSSIPAGTFGTIVNVGKPYVVRWQHQHSALEYLGSLLFTRLSNASTVDSSTGRAVDKEVAADIIALADSLVSSAASAGNITAAKHVLGRLSYGLDRNDDIIRVIFQIFEEELQAQVDKPGAEGSIYLLVNCVRFAQSLLKISPDRVWSLLARSKLLSLDQNAGGLVAIVSAAELPLGSYDLLRSSIGLFEGLIEDAVNRAVSRKSVTKALTRFEERAEMSGSTPEKLMSNILAGFQRIVLDVLQSSSDWRFVFAQERYEINARVLNAMKSMIDYTYGIDDNPAVSNKLTGIFSQACELIFKVFLAESPNDLTFQPILSILSSSLLGSLSALEVQQPTSAQTCAALAFCTSVLNVGLSTERKGTCLTHSLLQAIPVLARLFASSFIFKAPIATLMTSMVRSLNQPEAEPASLLGHLGSEATKCFLADISGLDKPVNDIDVEVAIWEMLSAVVSNKQQWLSIYLLTGATPRDRLKGKEKAATGIQSKPLLNHALDQLSTIKLLSPKRAIAMLEFVASAQNHWSWATNGIGKHADFIRNVAGWLSELVINSRLTDMEAATRAANENRMAALVADILARYLHNARQLGDLSIAKTIASKVQYLRDHAVAVDGYNHSLHKNLSKNFSNKFPQCSLTNFKRTTFHQVDFGREYYYNREMASRMLDWESSYSRRNGFADELARANVNLSFVESQVNLLKSWKALAVGLGSFAEEDVSLQKDLAKVVSNCLKANMDIEVPTALFDNIAQMRADLAFVILQQLVQFKSKEPEVRDLLSVAWDTVRMCGHDFEVLSDPGDANYYRSLLRILFLSLQPQIYNTSSGQAVAKSATASHKRAAPSPPPVANVLLEILQRVVTVNFRALCSAVHNDASTTSPADFVLVTALLQHILRVPGMSSAHSSVAAVFANAGTVRYAMSLYSWSDQLTSSSDTNDPIYGELSILFLLELSSVPLIAEQMAVESILSRISSANLSSYLRKPAGKGPFDEPVRMFSIWTRGILPLCLNLIEAVGPPIAAEIGNFLNSFPEQLKRAQSDLENRTPTLRHPCAGSVTLGLAAEIRSLSLVSLVLERLKAVG